ncbi:MULTISPECIES: acyltransferase [unclassified Bacillus cereus group]|uniref:acyltransferase n=1 Tax=Bacillus cereus group TaxID=86661 RepID=UPI0022DF0B7F|nr:MULTISPECIES: acyltransferase [unclassified Bacillus cereus group]
MFPLNKMKNAIKNYTYFKDYFRIRENKIPISLKQYIYYKLFNRNKKIYWPVHPRSIVSGNVSIGINSSVGATPGCYIQGIGEVYIGDYTLIGPNVGIISANHDILDYREHFGKKVEIGNYCWIGMNSVILPGVTLGNHTIVGAGSVVTKSFDEGYCIIAGNPARIVKRFNKNEKIDYKDEYEYYGYIPKSDFERYKEKYLNH